MLLKFCLFFFISISALAEGVPYQVDEEGAFQYPPIDDSKEATEYDPLPSNIEPTLEQKSSGVIKVTKEGEHIYAYQKGSTDHAMALRFGAMDAPAISNSDLTFEDVYGSGKQAVISFDYEWKKSTRAGVLSIVAGSGFAVSSGHGRFADDFTEAEEKYTFIALPNHLSFTYRFQYKDTQFIVPYIAGGAGYYTLAELRDDNQRNKLASAPVAIAGGGLMVSLTAFDMESAFELDNDYGVRDMWLSLDYRRLQGLNQDIDYSGNVINIGFVFDL